MSYAIDRSGLAERDPHDWSAAEESKYFADLADAQEWHFHRVKPMVVATMAGHIPFCPALHGGKIQKMEAADIWESITRDMGGAELAKLMAGYMNRDAHSEAAVWAEEQIDAFCNQTAAFMAKAEIA